MKQNTCNSGLKKQTTNTSLIASLVKWSLWSQARLRRMILTGSTKVFEIFLLGNSQQQCEVVGWKTSWFVSKPVNQRDGL